MNEENKSKNVGVKVLVVILILCILAAGGLLALKIFQNQPPVQETSQNGQQQEPEEPIAPVVTKTVDIYKGNDRPIAVMIDNHKSAQPQAGLNEAYAVYEIIVEGGESRLMAVFKGKDLAKIGPIRSARHYFLDYALENDAIYVHYGWSPQAERDISKLHVQNVNGLIYSSKDFWRVKDKKAPHNAVTSTQNILALAKDKKGYRTTSTEDAVLKYTVEEVNLENGVGADTIEIPYSKSNLVKYEYDATTQRYIRYSKGKEQQDWDTKETVTTKNIIITFAKNTTLNDGENKDRQTLDNVKKLNGYYITNGKAIKITCDKTTREGKTIYRDENGEEIQVNDGNTFFQICPIDANVKITAKEVTEPEVAE